MIVELPVALLPLVVTALAVLGWFLWMAGDVHGWDAAERRSQEMRALEVKPAVATVAMLRPRLVRREPGPYRGGAA